MAAGVSILARFSFPGFENRNRSNQVKLVFRERKYVAGGLHRLTSRGADSTHSIEIYLHLLVVQANGPRAQDSILYFGCHL